MFIRPILFVSLLANCATAQSDADAFCAQNADSIYQKELFADPTECHHFYQCWFANETEAHGLRQTCPENTFWHDSILQCMPEGSTACSDRCDDPDDVAATRGCYAGLGCRQFFKCANTASYSMCCPEGTTFNETACSCETSETCFDMCILNSPPVPTSTPAPLVGYNATVCRDAWSGSLISSVAGERNAFILLDNDGEAKPKQYCPAGTEFSLGDCACSVYNDENAAAPDSTVPRRSALVWLPFDGTLNDQSSNKFQAFAKPTGDEAYLDESVLYLTGSGYLSIPGLKTFDFRSDASFCAFFKGSSSGGLISNSKNSQFSVSIGLSGNSLEASLNLYPPTGTRTLSSTVVSNSWNHFCAIYTGNTFTLYLNGNNVGFLNFAGLLKISHSPIRIGYDPAFGYFTGYLDDVLIATFALNQYEMTAHRDANHDVLKQLGLI